MSPTRRAEASFFPGGKSLNLFLCVFLTVKKLLHTVFHKVMLFKRYSVYDNHFKIVNVCHVICD